MGSQQWVLSYFSPHLKLSGFSEPPGGRCALTKVLVADVFAVAGSGFDRPVVEVIKSTAARSGLVMAVPRTMPSILVSSGSLLVWVSGEALES